MNSDFSMDLPVLVALARNHDRLVFSGQRPESLSKEFSAQVQTEEARELVAAILELPGSAPRESVTKKVDAIRKLAFGT